MGRKQGAAKRKAPVEIPRRRELRMPEPLGILLLLCLHAGTAAAYRAMVPYGAGPDEGSHALFAATLAGEVTPAEGWAWGLPVFATAPDDPNFELHQPPLYYVLASVPYRVAGPSGAAAVSLLCSMLLVWLTYRLVRSVAAGDLALAAAAFVAVLPMHGFMALRVNNDPLTAVCWASVLWCWVLMLRDGPDRRRAMLAGLGLGAALLSKQNSLVLLPLGLVAAVLCGLRGRRWRDVAVCFAITFGLAAILAGWWYLRNQVLYGDFAAQRVFHERFLHPRAGRATPATMAPVVAAQHTTYWSLVLDWTVRTFVIYVGHGFERLPAAVTQPHLLLCWTAGLGATVGLGRRLRRGLNPAGAASLLLLAGMVLITVLLAQFCRTYFQAQGRYLHVMMPGWALLFTAGFAGFARSDSHARRYLLLIGPLWFGVLDLLVLTAYLPGLFSEGLG